MKRPSPSACVTLPVSASSTMAYGTGRSVPPSLTVPTSGCAACRVDDDTLIRSAPCASKKTRARCRMDQEHRCRLRILEHGGLCGADKPDLSLEGMVALFPSRQVS